jgi:hypothetical protein
MLLTRHAKEWVPKVPLFALSPFKGPPDLLKGVLSGRLGRVPSIFKMCDLCLF